MFERLDVNLCVRDMYGCFTLFHYISCVYVKLHIRIIKCVSLNVPPKIITYCSSVGLYGDMYVGPVITLCWLYILKDISFTPRLFNILAIYEKRPQL